MEGSLPGGSVIPLAEAINAAVGLVLAKGAAGKRKEALGLDSVAADEEDITDYSETTGMQDRATQIVKTHACFDQATTVLREIILGQCPVRANSWYEWYAHGLWALKKEINNSKVVSFFLGTQFYHVTRETHHRASSAPRR